jgi:hypothetical protein
MGKTHLKISYTGEGMKREEKARAGSSKNPD